MFKLLIFLLMLPQLISCNPGVLDKQPELQSSMNLLQSDKSKVYIVRRDDLIQTLTVNDLSKDKILFKLECTKSKEEGLGSIEGVAYLKAGDPESDIDKDGNMYPADEFVYSNECTMYIRIDMREKDKVRIKDVGCAKRYKSVCPFASVGLMESVP
jgi:hypothetical protein